jgi:hypothetical protein
MKHALALIFLSCALVAQNNPAAEAQKPAAAEKPSEAKAKIPPINVRDELIELIHQLKKEAGARIDSPSTMVSDPAYQAARATKYEADMKSKTEAKRLLLQALVELAKEAEKKESTKAYHSSNPTDGYLGF